MLVHSYTLGETGAAVSSSIVEVFDQVPPAFSTDASTFVSDGYWFFLSGPLLLIFNDTGASLQLLQSLTLSSNCRLVPGRGVLDSNLVTPFKAAVLAECDRKVYAVFPDTNSDFLLEKLVDVFTSAATKVSLTTLDLNPVQSIRTSLLEDSKVIFP